MQLRVVELLCVRERLAIVGEGYQKQFISILYREVYRLSHQAGLVESNTGSECLTCVEQFFNSIMTFSCGKGEKRRQKEPKSFGLVRAGAVCILIIKVFMMFLRLKYIGKAL